MSNTEVNRLPLSERLKNLKDGYPAHAEFVPCAIWSFANMPMGAYLDGFDMEMTALAESLGIPKDELASCTYKDIACQMMELKESPLYADLFPNAVTYLTAPIRNFWHIRREYAGKS